MDKLRVAGSGLGVGINIGVKRRLLPRHRSRVWNRNHVTGAALGYRYAVSCIGVGIRIGIKPVPLESCAALKRLRLLAILHSEGWQSGRMDVLLSHVRTHLTAPERRLSRSLTF